MLDIRHMKAISTRLYLLSWYEKRYSVWIVAAFWNIFISLSGRIYKLISETGRAALSGLFPTTLLRCQLHVYIMSYVPSWNWILKTESRHNSNFVVTTQRTHGTIVASLLRHNDVETSFWCNDDVIIASRVRWATAPLIFSGPRWTIVMVADTGAKLVPGHQQPLIWLSNYQYKSKQYYRRHYMVTFPYYWIFVEESDGRHRIPLGKGPVKQSLDVFFVVNQRGNGLHFRNGRRALPGKMGTTFPATMPRQGGMVSIKPLGFSW